VTNENFCLYSDSIEKTNTSSFVIPTAHGEGSRCTVLYCIVFIKNVTNAHISTQLHYK